MSDDIVIIGAGIHPFGRFPGRTGLEMAATASRQALADAGIEWHDVQLAAGGSADAGNADTLVDQLGMTGLPFINVHNGCATGGTALTVAASALRSGEADVALAVGFDKHPPGAFDPNPADWGLGDWYGETGLMLTTQFFAMKINRYLHDHGVDPGVLADIAEKAFDNGAKNPNAWRRTPFSAADIAAAEMISYPLTKFMFCSPGEGAVALVLATREADERHGATADALHLRAALLRTLRYGSFEVFAPSLTPERVDGPTVDASLATFEAAGIGPEDVDVAQIQDTEAGAELMHMAETGLCKHGEQEALIRGGATRIGGTLPINTDGGCIANGEPTGASGLRQVYENVLQLRGRAGVRQVPGQPKVAFTHVYGAPGVSACTVVTR
jgi:acetyl-CoA acetyltransferase